MAFQGVWVDLVLLGPLRCGTFCWFILLLNALLGILMPNKGRYRYNLSLVYGVDEWRQDEQGATLVVVKSARRFETGTNWY